MNGWSTLQLTREQVIKEATTRKVLTIEIAPAAVVEELFMSLVRRLGCRSTDEETAPAPVPDTPPVKPTPGLFHVSGASMTGPYVHIISHRASLEQPSNVSDPDPVRVAGHTCVNEKLDENNGRVAVCQHFPWQQPLFDPRACHSLALTGPSRSTWHVE